ncbi:MAG: hypothetical protein HY556_10245 [Euryarchaeota archaeon]|nr:hypothetical protein [Euryarchaeota archaeon]
MSKAIDFGFDARVVKDWNNEEVGRIVSTEVDPSTRTVKSLVIGLSADAKGKLGANEAVVTVPMNMVYGIRRNEVMLDRSVSELKRIDLVQSKII